VSLIKLVYNKWCSMLFRVPSVGVCPLDNKQSDERWSAGAVWVARRPGSRSANRIVQRRGEGPRLTGYHGKNWGTYYLSGKKVSWCTDAAWDSWVRKQGSEFVHVSLDHAGRG
jgi:hypothetical protein